MKLFVARPSSIFLPLLFLMSSAPSPTADAASPSMMTLPHSSAFLHSGATSKTASHNARKRGHTIISLQGGPESDGSNNNREAASSNTKRKRRTRPPRRGASQSSRNPRQRQPVKTGLSNMCPPLNGPIGAPELPTLTTKDPVIIGRWLDEHVGSDGSPDGYTILGFDAESIAKPPWKPERASLPDGPATVQLSTTSSCIIIQLSICGDGGSLYAPDILRKVINDPKIIKVGVGIDDDALELYRWSKESFEDPNQYQQQQTPKLWEMNSRFDLGCILPNNHPSKRSGLRELAEKVLGVEINKSKSLSMSNWGKRYLTLQQISYAARDAWVAAAIVEQLQKGNNDIFCAEALMEMDFMKSQRSMDEMDARAASRKIAKLELKEIVERQRSDLVETGKEDEERKQNLYSLMDLYRPDQPPTFGENAITLPVF